LKRTVNWEKVMLTEVQNTRQIKNEGRRRWFTDSDFDLIVWYEADSSSIAGFQLCYEKVMGYPFTGP
jgi:hypothetical protein